MKKAIFLSILACIMALSLPACVSTSTRESTGEYIDSSTTTTRVKAALIDKLGLSSVTGIEVTTFKGVVQLSGFVNSQHDAQLAVQTAKNVRGVIAIENSLIVKPRLR
jgi:osmotically-inducible protein OsmY